MSEKSGIKPLAEVKPIRSIVRRYILRAMLTCNGNKTHAARALGLNVRTLREKLKRYAAEGHEIPGPGKDGPATSND